MKSNTLQQVVPYNREQLHWHLNNNAFGMSPETIEQIISQCEGLNEGLHLLTDEIAPNTGVSFGEMLTDLQIDYNDYLITI
jgi:hypothetical protein